jgi:hypothetical protein
MPLLLLFLPLIARVLSQSSSTGCNSACMNYLAALENEKNIVNSNVWDYAGPVTAAQINTVCTLANPLACCDCGGTGITDTTEKGVLVAWALTCNTFNNVQDGGASAVNCWTSHFQQGCVDYDNLLEGGQCGTSSGGNNGSPASTPVSTSTPKPVGGTNTSPAVAATGTATGVAKSVAIRTTFVSDAMAMLLMAVWGSVCFDIS